MSSCGDAVLGEVESEESDQEMIQGCEPSSLVTASNDRDDQVIDHAKKERVEHEPDFSEARIEIFSFVAEAGKLDRKGAALPKFLDVRDQWWQ